MIEFIGRYNPVEMIANITRSTVSTPQGNFPANRLVSSDKKECGSKSR